MSRHLQRQWKNGLAGGSPYLTALAPKLLAPEGWVRKSDGLEFFMAPERGGFWTSCPSEQGRADPARVMPSKVEQ